MDVLGTGEVIAVLPLAMMRETLLHKADGNVQEQVQVRFREFKVAVLGVENPVPEPAALLQILQLGALVGDVGIDVAVQQDGLSPGERLPHSGGGPVPVFGKQKRHQLGVHCLYAAELSFQETGNEVSVDGGLVARKMNVFQRSAALL